jgi:DNA-binding GntR family transcriptional regulator
MDERNPKTLALYVLERLRSDIISSRYPPGTRLDQKLLAEELGVSLIPVREGLRQLEADGLIRIEPRRGVFVAQRSADELREISLIREQLEGIATEIAAMHLQDQQIQQLDHILQDMVQAIDMQDMHRNLELNCQFHFGIYEASGKPLLLRMINGLWERFRLYSHRDTFIADAARKSFAEHEAILAACIAHDAGAARARMCDHIRRATDAILAKIE